MPERNGTPPLAAVSRTRTHAPLVLRPETITYPLVRPDGETISLAGYVKGPGCPLPILIEVDEALATLEEHEPTAAERGSPGDPSATPPIPPVPGTLPIRRLLAKLNRAERILRRDMLMAVIPGLSMDDANLLAADGGPWKEILVELGWRQSDEEIEAAAREDDADPEAQAGDSTGLDGSPASSPATATTRSSRASA